MLKPRDATSVAFDQFENSLLALSNNDDIPKLDGSGTRALEAWFLGPKAENAEELEKLIVEALRDHVFWRRNFHPADPSHITEAVKRSPEYLQAQDTLKENLRTLLASLKKSVPFFSMRYQGHMNWDLTIPGIVGYFAAMLYNPNNVAFEGSTATTILEMRVGDDLCKMLGYEIPSNEEIDKGKIRPWGHITCDGTVANIEALWAARNVKLYPLAIRAAVQKLNLQALACPVSMPDGQQVKLSDLTLWQMVNISPDEVLKLSNKLVVEYNLSATDLNAAISSESVQSLGMAEFAKRYLAGVESPVVLVPGSKHYSFPKAAAVLGIGASNLIDVPVDLDARMDVGELKKIVDQCIDNKRPIYAVVAVLGTTEESSLDPLEKILALRDSVRKQGVDFIVHTDAAWGGYHVSTLRDDFQMPKADGFAPEPPPAVALSKYAQEQLLAMGRTDSITVDPHKSGYIPYPAGALCYRNSAMRHLVSFSAPVVFHGEAEPTVGIYGIEGSKPGTAVSSVFLSHSVIRPTRSGYGKIIGQALFSCKRLYSRLLTMARSEDPFICVPLPRLPAERDGRSGDISKEIELIRSDIISKTDAELARDTNLMKFLSELGPDENILSYAFNFKNSDGSINSDLAKMNSLNKLLYDQLKIEPGKDIYDRRLIVSTTDLAQVNYGPAFIADYKKRLGVAGSNGDTITVLRSVVMDPWVTETTEGSFLTVLETEYRRALHRALQQLLHGQARGY